MNQARQKKLLMIISGLLLGALVLSLVMYALRQNIALFYTPIQAKNGEAPLNQTIRLGGMVVNNSVTREKTSTHVSFMITDYKGTLMVEYDGILPDLFREGQGIVAQGILTDIGHFKASEVLAKHDENYMPKELRDSLKQEAKHDS